MLDRGYFITWQAVRRQLTAMPNDLYLVRLIHHATRRAFPGERLWSAELLTRAATVRFLRLRNREGCDIYIQPYAGGCNAGYILLDLDDASDTALPALRRDGLDPCLVLQTSPGRLQAWLHLSSHPLQPALATAAARHLARAYGGDPASADWRHLGRLAGFTNRKPARRTASGCAPWVTVRHARPGLAPAAESLLRSVSSCLPPPHPAPPAGYDDDSCGGPADAAVGHGEAARIYRRCVEQWRIPARFPRPDWSIVDLWVARALLGGGMLPAQVRAVLQLGSPQFPRRHGNPEDYLNRTLARAAAFSRPAPPAPV